MIVGVIQSNYIPWRGYFDFIDSVDCFVIHDDLLYTEGDWRNRNQILAPGGKRWLTVPVDFKFRNRTLIEDTEIKYSSPWIEEHLKRLTASYRAAPHFSRYFDPFREILETRFRTISELNVALIRWVMRELEITTPLLMSRELSLSGAKTDRLIELLRKTGATEYVSGRNAAGYLEKEKFAEAGIGLSFKSYDYAPYPQLGDGFDPAVSVLDLLFNCGPDSRSYLSSRSPNETVVPPIRLSVLGAA